MSERRATVAGSHSWLDRHAWIALLTVGVIVGGCGAATSSGSPEGTTGAAASADASAAASAASSNAASVAPSASSAAVECQPGGTLVMARNQEPDTLNPVTGTSSNGTIFAAMQVFERLLEQSSTSREPVPGIASSYEAAPDGLSYTFHLRPGKFSNGDPITAEDVKFSLDRFRDPDLDLSAGFLASNIKDVVVVDPSTVRIDMSHVDASIIAALTLMEASITPKKVVTELGDEKFGLEPVGSGPFMVKQWSPGQSLELARNPNYAVAGKPYLDGVTFNLVKDDNARILQAQSGDAQVVEAIPVPQSDTVKAIPGWTLHNDAILAQDNVWLNHSWKAADGSQPLSDKLVRQALNYATPKDDINQLVFNGLAQISNTGTTITQFWDKDIPPYPLDVEKAKALLAQTSVPNGFDLPMSIPAGDSVAQQTAELVQQAWSQIGVNVTIEPQDPAVQSDKVHALDYGSAIRPATQVTSDTPDDSELASIMYDWGTDWKSFFTDYKSDAATKLVHDAVGSTVPSDRAAMYSQLQKLTLDDAVSVPLVIPPALTAVSDKVKGFETIPAGWWLLQDVCMAP